jgi:hypothetical protein
MTIYRIKFQTEVLVDATSEWEAEKFAQENLVKEIEDGRFEISFVERLKSVNQLRGNEVNIFPWKNKSRLGENALDILNKK